MMIWFGWLRWPIQNSSGRSWFQATLGFGAVDFELETVLPAGRNLADGESAAGVVAQADEHGAEIVGVDGDFVVFGGAQIFSGEGFHRSVRALAGFVEGGEIGAQGGDALAGEVLDHVHPMRSDIAHGAERAALFGLTRQFQSVSCSSQS